MNDKWKCPKCGGRTQIAWDTCDSCSMKQTREMTSYLHLTTDQQTKGFALGDPIGQLFTIKRRLNGGVATTFEIRCLNQYHRNVLVKRWNEDGKRMAKIPNPATGEIMHWSYEVCDTGHDETLFPQAFLGAGI